MIIQNTKTLSHKLSPIDKLKKCHVSGSFQFKKPPSVYRILENQKALIGIQVELHVNSDVEFNWKRQM